MALANPPVAPTKATKRGAFRIEGRPPFGDRPVVPTMLAIPNELPAELKMEGGQGCRGIA
jgi:hypothetical protein